MHTSVSGVMAAVLLQVVGLLLRSHEAYRWYCMKKLSELRKVCVPQTSLSDPCDVHSCCVCSKTSWAADLCNALQVEGGGFVCDAVERGEKELNTSSM